MTALALLAGALVTLVWGAPVIAAPTGPIAALIPIAVNDTGSVAHGRTRNVAAPGVMGNDLQLGAGFIADLVDGPDHGSVDLDENGAYRYTADDDYVGIDHFRYELDGGLLGLSNTATVTITVTNAAPVARPDEYDAVADVELSVPVPGLLANDTDADGDELEVDIVEEPEGNLNERDDGSFRYEADDDDSGLDTFRYRVWDGFAWSATVTVEIHVSPEPTPRPPTPTPAPTQTPTPTPNPTTPPTAAPTPTTPTGASPRPTMTPRPSPSPTESAASERPGATPTPSPRDAAAPSATPSANTSSGPDPSPTSSASTGVVAPPRDPGTPGSDGGSGPGDPGEEPARGPTRVEPFVVPVVEETEVGIDAGPVAFGGFDWAVPALVLTVPGLLLMLAILAQAAIGLVWLPVARRWLGGDRKRPALVRGPGAR